MKPVYSLDVPEYTTDQAVDYVTIGQKIDKVIVENFAGRPVALRYLSLHDHPSLSLAELIETIDRMGTDKYDPARQMSVAHDFYIEKGVELFAVAAAVGPDLGVSAETLQDFAEGAIEDRGQALRIDLVVVYDLLQLEPIPIEYPDGMGNDAFKFKNPSNKPDSVLGFIKIL
jgi:hypothetical protein